MAATGSYTPTVWNSGAAPGIDATELNNIETQYDLAIGDTITEKVVKGSDESVTSSTTFQNDDELTIAVAANAEIHLIVGLHIGSASATPDFKAQFTGPTGSTLGVFCNKVAASGSTVTTSIITTTPASGGTLFLGAGIDQFIIYHVYLQNGANAGSVTLQWAQNTSDGTATIVRAKSFLYAVEIK